MAKNDERRRSVAASRRFPDGSIIEIIRERESGRTRFAIYKDGRIAEADEVDAPDGSTLVPVSGSNNLIRHGALLLPERAESYGDPEKLAASIADYIYRYVDVSDTFRTIATYYVMLSWLHDAFNELPYLRIRGDFGSGKTRALAVIGSICYRPFFASGASTVSPIFHTLDAYNATLVLDEADFRFTDEKNELVKLLNNGNVKGFPVLRTAVTAKREFDPRAFQVFGPKVVAMRRSFEDPALESRFLTEEAGQRPLRPDIPIGLPGAQKEGAAALRNMLLMYRFEKLGQTRTDDSAIDRSLSPRANQILAPLLSLIGDDNTRNEVREAAHHFESALYGERASTIDALVLEALLQLFSDPNRSNVSLAEIVAVLNEKHGDDYERPFTNRQIGGILRRRLRIATWKSHGVYVVPATEKEKIVEMAGRYGLLQDAIREDRASTHDVRSTWSEDQIKIS